MKKFLPLSCVSLSLLAVAVPCSRLRAQAPANVAPVNIPDAPQPNAGNQADGSNKSLPLARLPATTKKRPCPGIRPQDGQVVEKVSPTASSRPAPPDCREEDPVQAIVETPTVRPLTSNQKGLLAARDLINPFNLLTIGLSSTATIGFDAHTAYGPGLKGAGRLAGYSFVEAATGEFFATYAIASLTHEDPRYHRMPGRPAGRRLLHAVLHTYVAHHDDGSPMPNYGVLVTYPITAEMFNLYVPGTQTDLPSTGRRVAIGIATNPVGDIIAEFLPDVARRVHVRIVFIQAIMNQVALGAPSVQ